MFIETPLSKFREVTNFISNLSANLKVFRRSGEQGSLKNGCTWDLRYTSVKILPCCLSTISANFPFFHITTESRWLADSFTGFFYIREELTGGLFTDSHLLNLLAACAVGLDGDCNSHFNVYKKFLNGSELIYDFFCFVRASCQLIKAAHFELDAGWGPPQLAHLTWLPHLTYYYENQHRPHKLCDSYSA